MVSVNDDPVNTVPGAQATNEDTSIVFTGATAISISDVDGGPGDETTTLSVSHGTLTFSGSSAGLTLFTNGAASITLTGSVAEINTALSTLTYAPTADYNGVDQLQVETSDNGNTGTGGALTDTDTVDITISADADVVTDNLTTNEDNAITANVLTGTNGASADNFENGLRAVTAVTQGVHGSVGFLANGDVTYTPNADFSGADTFTYTVTSGGVTEIGTVNVSINAVNDAPVLSAAATLVLDAENEDAGAPVNGTAVGTLVSSLVDLNPPAGGNDNVTDIDANPVTGIALTSTAGGGIWHYSIDDGATWNAVGAVSDGSALLLAADANTRLYYQPAADVFGTISPAITFRAWDQSAGTNGQSGVNTVPNGTTTPFSTATDTADITINSINDAPVFAGLDNNPSFVENGSSVVLDNNATVSDIELDAAGSYDGAQLTLVRHTGPDPDDVFGGSGTLDLSSGTDVVLGGTTIGTFSQPGDGTFAVTFNSNATAADVDSVLQQLTYQNVGDNPPASLVIDYTFSDGNGVVGGQAQGGGPTPGIGVGSITVSPITQIDDAPSLLNVAVAAAYTLGTSGVAVSPGLNVFDPDATPPSPLTGLASATIKIESGFFAGDALFVNLTNAGGFFRIDDGNGGLLTTNISVQSNVLGTLVLSGNDTVANYQSVLHAVSYNSTAVDPSNGGANPTRNISWLVNDGALNSQTPNPDPNNLVNATVLHFNAPPSLDLDASGAGTGFTTTFTERDAPIPIVDTDVLITDLDNTTVASATIVLTNAKPADVMSIAGALPGGIDSAIDTSLPGQITIHLTNSASLAEYQTALGQIVGSSRVDLQACKLEYSIVSPK